MLTSLRHGLALGGYRGSLSTVWPSCVRTMMVGIPKEIKVQEDRVALTPAKASEFVRRGHQVIVEASAGIGSGFPDDLYRKMGCRVVPTADEVFKLADMIMKVKEPCQEEYGRIRPNQIIFTYFHFASSKELTEAMIKNESVCIAYETVTRKDGTLPLLIPMSEIAGRMAVQEGAKYLEKPMGGRGVLLGGVPGVRPGRILVLGGGVVGSNAARIGAGMGADVVVADVDLAKLRQLEGEMPKTVRTVYSTDDNIMEEVKKADLIIGSVLIAGARCPQLVTREMLKGMKPGAVVIDVAVDQGGCIETCRPTTHDDPTYFVDGVLHYCVSNMPGAVPYTSTLSLSNATLRYGLHLADSGWKKACRMSEELRSGVNIANGKVTIQAVADAFDIQYTNIEEILSG